MSKRRTVVVAVMVMALAVRVGAHDPGLSALDISIGEHGVEATLAVALADVQALEALRGDALMDAAGNVARQSVDVHIDGRRLASDVKSVVVQNTRSVEVTLAFEPLHGERLAVQSQLPLIAPRGHRELVTVKADGHLLISRLFDAANHDVAVSIPATPSRDGARDSGPALLRDRVARFVAIGVSHILSGYDHLVFLAGLLLASRRIRQVVAVLSAFTVAHSLSLALAASGVVHLSPSLVEPLIALSIAYVGVETLLRRGQGPDWRIVFTCGLIHGLGFAGALLDLGLGATASQFLLSLLSFNVGVEAGQLMVAALAVPVIAVLRQWPMWQTKLAPACSIAVAVSGVCWFVQRLL